VWYSASISESVASMVERSSEECVPFAGRRRKIWPLRQRAATIAPTCPVASRAPNGSITFAMFVCGSVVIVLVLFVSWFWGRFYSDFRL
jgi:hypothetical protein